MGEAETQRQKKTTNARAFLYPIFELRMCYFLATQFARALHSVPWYGSGIWAARLGVWARAGAAGLSRALFKPLTPIDRGPSAGLAIAIEGKTN